MGNHAEEPVVNSTTQDGLSFDVIIIGAGISGINAAYRIQTEGPSDLTYAILEGRDSIGGTWDLFQYPGIRSDSDIFTFGFPWSPWKHNESLAAGDKIKDYMIESARSAGIDHHICYNHTVLTANWRSGKKTWELQVTRPGEDEPTLFQARFLLLGTGYYDYQTPLQTVIPGIEKFEGKVIHPQFWPKDYDYTHKNVVVIGSGATAVTIVPSMADRGGTNHYVAEKPGLPPDVSWDPHFKPRYNPWEQRFCACMNGDFFAAIRSGKADVVTDTIKTVTEKSIVLQSGAVLHPDVIVTATGLKLRFGGGIKFAVDDQPFNVADKFAWRAAMLQDVPNLLFMTGYENASWTLGADVSARLFVRILQKMRQRKASVAVPRNAASKDMPVKPMMSLSSTYLKNAGAVFPKGGTGLWSPKSNYFADMAGASWGDVAKDLEFS
ncbi:hypothetical protein NW754_004065 [Fusarium falciforme]|nr:hypothetical protein NW754_004065 [Fusarium falciforme]